MAPRYRPGRIIIPATKDRFTNNLPDLSQLLCVPINTDELDTITSNMGNIFSNTLETVAPIKLKKVREKCAAPWYNSYTHSLKKLVILSANGEKLTWKYLELRGKTVCMCSCGSVVEHCVCSAKVVGLIPREHTYWQYKCIAWMHCKSLWIKASAKCIDVNVCPAIDRL